MTKKELEIRKIILETILSLPPMWDGGYYEWVRKDFVDISRELKKREKEVKIQILKDK